MAANESVLLKSIRDVVGDVLRDLRALVSERAFYRLDWPLDIVNRYTDSLSKTVDLDQVHFLPREARECLCAHSGSFAARFAQPVFNGHRGRPCYRIMKRYWGQK